MDEPNNGFLDRGPTPLNITAAVLCFFATILLLLVDFRNPFLFLTSLCCGYFCSRVYG